MIKFAYTILYVPDVLSAISFYEQAFGFTRKFIAPGNDYGELVSGTTSLSFASYTLAESNLKEGFIKSDAAAKPFAIEIGFSTDDVAGTFDKAVAVGAIAVAPLQVKPWGQQVAYVRDPNGFLIEICSPVL